MKRFTDVYKRNNTSGMPFHNKMGQALRKAEVLSTEVIEAIESKNIEKRYLRSEELIRMMVEIHDVFHSENPKGIDLAMQKYCLGNINLLTKINWKNDKDLAITLKQSFFEAANMWDAYQP